MDDAPLELVSQAGAQLCRLSRPSKDSLLKSLREVAESLVQIQHACSSSLEGLEKKKLAKKQAAALLPMKEFIVKREILRHADREVQLLVSVCVAELFRILAPETPFADKHLRDVFKLILGTFSELADTGSPYFGRRASVLEAVARCECCVVMLDVQCGDLVLELFKTFFSVVRAYHDKSVKKNMLHIMSRILNEEPSQRLADVILQNLIKEEEGPSQLAVYIIQKCDYELEPFVCGFFNSCFLNRDAVENDMKESYHVVLYEVYKCAPRMLLTVIPYLSEELRTDQVDVRVKAVNLLGKLLALRGDQFAREHHDLFTELKNRFSDKSVDVRRSALHCARAFYIANPCWKASEEILSAFEGRLLDLNDEVRAQAVVIICDLASSNLESFPPGLVVTATERLRDKKLSVRKKALARLMKLYQDYCIKCSQRLMAITNHFERIPTEVLMLCCIDSKAFRSQTTEHTLWEDLFPANLSAEERTRHWVHIVSLFTPLHWKVMASVLSKQNRLQTEMRTYLSLRKNEKENTSEVMQKNIKKSISKMSASFPDPPKAQECFYILNQLKDCNVFSTLELLLEDLTIDDLQKKRKEFLKLVGDKHPQLDFLQLLSLKCSFSIFNSEIIRCVLVHLSSEGLEIEQKKASAKLILAVVSIFPSLLRGSETEVQMLLEDDTLAGELVEVLAKAGSHIFVEFSDFDAFLRRQCIEGTRVVSKHAVSAIASMAGTSEQVIFSQLCEELVNSLRCGWKTSTVLQSLGCIAQHSLSTFEIHGEEIRSYIFNIIFKLSQSDGPACSEERLNCSDCCQLKIFGLKTLVKSFLPHQGSHFKWAIDKMLAVLLKMLQTGDTSDGVFTCENDKLSIRLSAAKSILMLSNRWDLHISPKIFQLTTLMAKDSSPVVRKSFLHKTHKLLKKHAIPVRYACAFALAAHDPCEDLRDASSKYMGDIINDYVRDSQFNQNSAGQRETFTGDPAYMVVYLIYILAHDDSFPLEECQDERVYAHFCSPLFWVIQELTRASNVKDRVDVANGNISRLLCVLYAIKKAEDAIDPQATPKLRILADIGILMVKSLQHNALPVALTQGPVLLPSSLYKLSPVDLKYVSGSSDRQDFLTRLIPIQKSGTFMPAGHSNKRSRDLQEDKPRSCGTENNALVVVSLPLQSLIAPETQGIVAADVSLGQMLENALSPDLESEGLCSNHTATEIQLGCASTSCNPISSTDSATVSPSMLQPEALNQKSDGYVQSLEDTCIFNRERSMSKRSKLSSAVNTRFSKDMIVGFASNHNIHKTSAYDTGEMDLLCLETCEKAKNSSSMEKENMSTEELYAKESSHCELLACPSLNVLKDSTNSSGVVAKKSTKVLANNDTASFTGAKGKKERDVAPSKTTGEVSQVVRRSKRLKK
ncbi:unnamed protein product [Linum trigynum]|uniref:Sister chromatid cohesion protein PDS5 homolog A n=1 Tax=Linum trigynum TaxID=586398 RepID=A0AAV2D1U5_9ROSI